MEPLRLKIKCQGMKRGKTSSGQDYIAIFFKGRVTGFVPKDRISSFDLIKKGDIVNTYVYSYQQGITFIPQSYVSCRDDNDDNDSVSDPSQGTGEDQSNNID